MKKKELVVIKPERITDLDGKNERYYDWGKFGFLDGKIKEIYFNKDNTLAVHPIFSSVWPYLRVKANEIRPLKKHEWVEYFSRLSIARCKYFLHFQKLAFKGLIGK